MIRQIIACTLITSVVAFSAPNNQNLVMLSEKLIDSNDATVDSQRRSWIKKSIALGSASLIFPRAALADIKYDLLQDQSCDFQISVPATWEKSEQKLPDRRSISFYIDPSSAGEEKNLFFSALTPIRDDFTSLSSFGSVDQVAQQTILPRGELNMESTKSVMLKAESKKNAYIFDYKVTPPNLSETHYRTVFYLAQGATGGAGAVLVTLTAQCPESRYGEMKPVFDQMIESFGKYKA
mmetsp:Transcript_10170/g.14926  ORF Transcript_10170/g.14926 Transcript_10170/m.14926 type:complete len:237 (-) Transcript_10170:793-1503(-)